MRRFLVVVLAAITVSAAAPAQASTPTVTDLKLVHLTARPAATYTGAQKVTLRMVAKNGGPDTAADVTVTMTSLSNATIQQWAVGVAMACQSPYGGDHTTASDCSNRFPVPSKDTMKAQITVRMVDETQPVSATFCVSVDPNQSPDQVDPTSANDCASITYTP